MTASLPPVDLSVGDLPGDVLQIDGITTRIDRERATVGGTFRPEDWDPGVGGVSGSGEGTLGVEVVMYEPSAVSPWWGSFGRGTVNVDVRVDVPAGVLNSSVTPLQDFDSIVVETLLDPGLAAEPGVAEAVARLVQWSFSTPTGVPVSGSQPAPACAGGAVTQPFQVRRPDLDRLSRNRSFGIRSFSSLISPCRVSATRRRRRASRTGRRCA